MLPVGKATEDMRAAASRPGHTGLRAEASHATIMQGTCQIRATLLAPVVLCACSKHTTSDCLLCSTCITMTAAERVPDIAGFSLPCDTSLHALLHTQDPYT